jgi:hypothetical protein
MHHFEAWNEAICNGAWGKRAAKYGEHLRQYVDLEHWSAFHTSFEKMIELLRAVGAGRRGRRAPSSITILSGDVHHGYLAKLEVGDDEAEVESPIYQAVSSPLRQEIEVYKRRLIQVAWSRIGEFLGWLFARLAGAPGPGVSWSRIHDGLWLDNHLGTLEFNEKEVLLTIQGAVPANSPDPRLQEVFEYRLV